MLFDIRGRRKRFIQVIYVFLALLLGGSLVFFGIGGDAPGGLGDALGISEQSGGGDPGFEQQIEEAEQALATDPENAQALLTLARYRYLDGQRKIEVDEEGQQAVTEETLADFEASVDAWERYLDARRGPVDSSVATLVFRAYSTVAFANSNPATVQRRLEGAQRTAAVVAEERPGPNSYLELAISAYMAGDEEAAEEAAENALEEVDDAGRSALEQQLEAAERQGRQVRRQLKQASQQESELDSPLGQLADPAAGDPQGGG
jgi:tetratricopeptide (TPR) repeat protein